MVLALFLGSFLLSSAAYPQTTTEPRVRSEMLVSTQWLAQHLSDPSVAIIEVGRDRSHYAESHLPGARFIALDEIAETRAGVPNELRPAKTLQALLQRAGASDFRRIILYGDGSGLLAARAYFTIDYLGHGDHAALLDGGMEKWMAEKRPVTRDIPKVETGTLTLKIQPSALVVLPVMSDLSQEAGKPPSSVVVIDARPRAQYDGTADDKRSGHIPGAASLYWMQSVVSKENPVLRPVPELRKLYRDAGATPGKKIVTYCHSGIQAAHDYFTAKYLGYDVSMYDGSFSEWSAAPDTNVEKSSSVSKPR